MELFKLQCPECGAAINLDKETNYCFCPYCGTRFKFDDGIQRGEYTVSIRDEAKLKELELKEEERKRQEQKEYEAQQQAARARAIAAKAKLRSTVFIVLIIIAAFGLLSYGANHGSSKEKPLIVVSPEWYNNSPVVVPEIKLNEKTVSQTKGPLSYEIPKSWEIGNTTVDEFHSEYEPWMFAFNEALVTVDLAKIDENTDDWDRDTRNRYLDALIRKLMESYKLKELSPMIIGDRVGVHAEGYVDISTHPLHMYVVTAGNYICSVKLNGDDVGFEKKIEEVNFMLQSMNWDC